ncbi:hypothetical protein AWB77_06734 [Caballeronia fortuita]|uniref:Uncharacterized protein n=1 Tax=Caballeronia fortuita TaxID=1777138 RepID=A0A158E918_9BURK|nr:hypothetical protein [Caballeronia fortuita]SAL03200.1 hypothetical protein AWB77_06734 [Caballeronia fortuita]
MKTLTKASLIADTKTIIERSQAALASLGDVGRESHVVAMGGMFMAYSVDGTGRYIDPRPVAVANATRMPQAVAIGMANCTKNGAGQRGEALHVRDAMRRNLDNLLGVLADLRGV